VETIGSKRSYALIWCMPNNDDDEPGRFYWFLVLITASFWTSRCNRFHMVL